MKTANIALFKYFLAHRKIGGVFASFYRLYGSKNKNVEEYLTTVDAKIVLALAFPRMPETMPDNIYNPAFWADLDCQWRANLYAVNYTPWYKIEKEHERIAALPLNALTIESVKVPNYADPRRASAIYAERLAQEREELRERERVDGENAEKAEKAAWDYIDNGDKQVTVPPPKTPQKAKETPKKARVDTPSASSFKFFDLTPTTKTQSSKRDNVLFVNTRSGSYKVTFYRRVAKEVAALPYMRIGRDEYTGDVRIVFSRDDSGLRWLPNKGVSGGASCIYVNSKALVELLKRLFHHEKDEWFYLRVSPNLAHVDEYRTYQITDNADVK